MTWRRDCTHFVGDQPCAPHKRSGVLCDSCLEFAPSGRRILVVKLAAAGDVLRTTALLEPLHATYGPCTVTWITAPESEPLLRGNPRVARVLSWSQDPGALPLELATESFDVVLNFDSSSRSCALASAARAEMKLGYVLAHDGKPMPVDAAADDWFELGLNDQKKRANKTAYLTMMAAIARVPPPRSGPTLELNALELARARAFAKAHGIEKGDVVVGLNTGAGRRWPLKKWTLDGFRGLIDRLAERRVKILLLGGPEEAERNRELAADRANQVIDAGTGHRVRDFAALVDLCDVVVTGDTLAMHVALARNKQVVVMFGPTSSAEVDLFGHGDALTSAQMDCLVCYLTHCEKDPNCMNTISVDTVLGAVLGRLERAGRPAGAVVGRR